LIVSWVSGVGDDQPVPSYDVLAGLVVRLGRELSEERAARGVLAEALERALARVAELEAQVGWNSRNSSLSRDPDNEEFREFAFTCARSASISAFAFSNAARNSAI